jgi:SAM-dependent methyltransferase
MREHWQQFYCQRQSLPRSYCDPIPETSLAMIMHTGIGLNARIIDIGCGDSSLADRLVERGHKDVAVLDFCPNVLERVYGRLGERQSSVTFLNRDVRKLRVAQRYSVWHDHATFHFFVSESDRSRYKAAIHDALPAGASAVFATYGPTGPAEACGLPTCRYSAEMLASELGGEFRLERSCLEVHRDSCGVVAEYLYASFQRL